MYFTSQQQELNLQSPISNDSATMGIKMGSVSLSSSTSKEGHPQILPHLASERLEDTAGDSTFGGHNQGVETTANTTTGLEESKEEHKGDSKAFSDQEVSKDDPNQPLLEENSLERALPVPGSNLPPQLQAEGEAFTNELLQYLL